MRLIAMAGSSQHTRPLNWESTRFDRADIDVRGASLRPVLSLFPGVDLLGRGFAAEGYCVVTGPDILVGSKIEEFRPVAHAWEGLIGGSPCQDFSRARRCPPTGDGVRLIGEFLRCVVEASPDWFLLENVPGVPDVRVPGYTVQRFNLSASECGSTQSRLRTFQFGSLDGIGVVIRRSPRSAAASHRCCMASEGSRPGRRSWADFCELQGLPRDFELPSFTQSGRYHAVGNGVPIPMGRVVAAAIRRRRDTATARVCVCQCGRPVEGNQLAATAACRKRMERRRRDIAGVSGHGPVTPGRSQIS